MTQRWVWAFLALALLAVSIFGIVTLHEEACEKSKISCTEQWHENLGARGGASALISDAVIPPRAESWR